MEILFRICSSIWNNYRPRVIGELVIQALWIHWHPNRHLCHNNAHHGSRWLNTLLCISKTNRQLQESSPLNSSNEFFYHRLLITMVITICRSSHNNSYRRTSWVLLYTNNHVMLWSRMWASISNGWGTGYRNSKWWIVVLYILDNVDHKFNCWIWLKIRLNYCNIHFHGVYLRRLCVVL